MDRMFAVLLFVVIGSGVRMSPADMVGNASGLQDQEHPDLTLEHADVPFYPPIARAGRISGAVGITVQVKDGSVSDATAKSGPAILATAAAENVRTWRFHRWVNTRFSTKFIYRIETNKQFLADPRIELELPLRVVITTVPPLLDTTGVKSGLGK